MKKSKRAPVETDGVQYRRSKTYVIALSVLPSAAFFSAAIGLVSYAANLGFGIATVIVGTLLTVARVFDGITDPIISMVIDRVNTRFGKIRLFLVTGWVIMSLSLKMLFDWFCGKGHSLPVFLFIYLLYYIGYTISNMATQLVNPVLTNDPKQRPMIGVWSTLYNYVVNIVISIGITIVLLPMNGGEYTTGLLAQVSTLAVVCSFIFMLISMIGLSVIDKPEHFQSVGDRKGTRLNWRDMFALLKDNRALQCFIFAATSDKLAMTISGQAIISTILFGIIIGNMSLGAILNMVAILPALVFAVVGGKYTGKHGSVKATSFWSCVCIAAHVLFAVLLLVSAGFPMIQNGFFMLLFVVLTMIKNGLTVVLSIATNAMLSDVVDYEAYRSGNYMPGVVAGVYSFIDKVISSLGAFIATFCVSLIGYQDRLPQPTDTKTMPIVVMGIILMHVFPILGYVCSVIAMKKTPLSKEKMIEVQKEIAGKKQAAGD